MRIPADAKVVRDSRINFIRAIKTLNDRLVDGDNGMTAKVKASLQDKDAGFAESDYVVAALRAGAAKSAVNPRKLYKLVESGALKLNEFLDCITVRKEPLKEFLSGVAIEKLEDAPAAPATPQLITEWKEGVQLDVDSLAMELAKLIPAAAASVPIKSK